MPANPNLQTDNCKLITIVGPTASGKSSLAINLAKKFNAEVISADSRQIYKGMDIGTGKVTQREMRGITHHLLNVASPKRRFTASQYRGKALQAINNVCLRRKIPLLCGGTGFYIQAVIDGLSIPEVKPDWKLRKKLEKMEARKLFGQLKALDKKRAKTIDRNNKRRLVRALEILLKTKRRIPELKKNPLACPVLIIGVKKEKEELNKLIRKRFFKWLDDGFIKEVRKMRKNKVSWKRIEEFGLHYKQAGLYLQKKISYEEFMEKSIIELQKYAKRQAVWFQRDKRINWVKNNKEAERLASVFLGAR